MEADKFQDLGLGPRKVNTVVPQQGQAALGPRKIWYFSWHPKAGKKPMSQYKDRHVGGILSYSRRVSLFFLLRPSNDWMRDTQIKEGHWLYLFSLSIQILISSRNTLTGAPRVMFDQRSAIKEGAGIWTEICLFRSHVFSAKWDNVTSLYHGGQCRIWIENRELPWLTLTVIPAWVLHSSLWLSACLHSFPGSSPVLLLSESLLAVLPWECSFLLSFLSVSKGLIWVPSPKLPLVPILSCMAII